MCNLQKKTNRGDTLMSKKKKFLSLLMGAISSLSIAGAKGKNIRVKNDKTISSTSKKLGDDLEGVYYEDENISFDEDIDEDINDELGIDDFEELRNEKYFGQLSLSEQIIEKLKNEIIPNLSDLSRLNNKDDIKFFSSIFSDSKFKQKLEDLSNEGKFSEISKLIFEKYKDIWEDEAVLDLQKSVQKASYGYFEEGAEKGCGVVLDNAKDKLGKGHSFDFARFRFYSEKEVKPVFLRTVFCHLAISDFYKLESISYKKKGICDLMRQTILKSYVGEKFLDLKCLDSIDRSREEHDKFYAEVIEMDKRGEKNTKEKWDLLNECDDKLSKNREELANKIDNLLTRSNHKIEIPWFKKALDSRTRVYTWIFGDYTYFRWSRFSLIHFKALFSKNLKSTNCLDFLW